MSISQENRVRFSSETERTPLEGRLRINTEPRFHTTDMRFGYEEEERLKVLLVNKGETETLREIMRCPDMDGFSYVDVAYSKVTMADGKEIEMRSDPYNERRIFIEERVQLMSLEEAEKIAREVRRQSGGFRGDLAIKEAKRKGVKQIVYIHKGQTPDNKYGWMYVFRPGIDRIVPVTQPEGKQP